MSPFLCCQRCLCLGKYPDLENGSDKTTEAEVFWKKISLSVGKEIADRDVRFNLEDVDELFTPAFCLSWNSAQDSVENVAGNTLGGVCVCVCEFL